MKVKKPTAKPIKPAAKATSKPESKGKLGGTRPKSNAATSKSIPTSKRPSTAHKEATKLNTKAQPKKTATSGSRTASPPRIKKTDAAPAAKPSPKPVVATKVKPPKIDATKAGKGNPNLRVEAAIPMDKDLSTKAKNGLAIKDRVHLTAPDAYWLHVFWELSMQSVERAEAALNQDWHGAKPIIRLCDVTSTDTTSTSEAIVRDITVHGGCTHWYIDIPQPPRMYRADIGYLTKNGRFYPLARSNVLTPPKAGSSEQIEGELPADTAADHANQDEFGGETFHRPFKESAFGTGAVLPGKLKKFFFELDAELIVYVKTDPNASVTLQNEPIKIRPDGTATMRYSLPDSRQIIPAVATSADGMEEQTIVLAVERNTKRLDPMLHDLYNDA